MRKDLTPRQMINAELATRAINKKIFKFLGRFIPHNEKELVKVPFNCECVDSECQEHIELTLKEYKNFHQNFSHFIVAKGHIEPKIEKVKVKTEKLTLVEKPSLNDD